MNLSVAQIENSPQKLPATLDKIESAIALAEKPEEINQVLALMDAAVAYAKRFYKDQQDVIQRAKGLRLQAERKLGEILRVMQKSDGGRPAKTSSKAEPVISVPTLADIGIDKKTSMRAQRLAALPEKKFAAVAAGEISVAKANAKVLRAIEPTTARDFAKSIIIPLIEADKKPTSKASAATRAKSTKLSHLKAA